MSYGDSLEQQMADWEAQFNLYQTKSTKVQSQAEVTRKNLEAWLKKRDPWIEKWFGRGGWENSFSSAIWSPRRWFTAPVGPSSAEINKQRVELKGQLNQLSYELEYNDFYSRLYGQVPFAITSGKVATAEEVLNLLKPPSTLSDKELGEVRAIIDGMVATLTGETPPVEMAGEMAELELPELQIPEPATLETSAPVTLGQITTEEIIKALQTPASIPPPESALSQEEWEEYLISGGYNPEDPDADLLASQAESLMAEWQERDSRLEAFRSGIAEMPDYSVLDMLKEAVVQPGLALMEIAGFYFEHVSQPLAGALYKTFVPDIEAKYQEYKQSESTWKALSHAWQEWDAPGDGAVEWILKYMVMEGITDPLSYVGWGIATKITRPLGAFGRLVGAAERGFMSVLDIPFDLIKAGLKKLPKTITQRAALTQAEAVQFVDKWVSGYTNKSIRDLANAPDGMLQFNNAIDRAIRGSTLMPGIDNSMTRAGNQLLKHTPVNEGIVLDWSNRLSATAKRPGFLTSESITKELVESVDGLFEDFFWRGGPSKQRITSGEAASKLLGILGISNTDDTWKLAKALFESRSKRIVRAAKSFGMAETPVKSIYMLGKRNYQIYIATEESAAYLARKQTGAFASRLQDVSLRLQQVWRNSIDKWIVRPFAEAYLAFALYGPMNMIEDIWRSTLGGTRATRVNAERFGRKWVGIGYDANLMRDAWSETLGELRRGPEAMQTNWILSMGGLAKGLGEKTYGALVEKPGQIGLDFRRGFVDAKATQILADTGGDTLKKLASIESPKPRLSDTKLAKEVYETVNDLKLSGNPDTVRFAKEVFTKKKIIRAEVNDILMEHPDMPRTVRDKIIKDYDDNILFQGAPREGATVREGITPELTKREKLLRRNELQNNYNSLSDKIDKLTAELADTTDKEARQRIQEELIALGKERGSVLSENIQLKGEDRILNANISDSPEGVFILDSGLDQPREATYIYKMTDEEASVYRKLESLPNKERRAEQKALVDRILARESLLGRGKPAPAITKASLSTPVDSITRSMDESRDILMDDFIRSPEVASEQMSQLADFLTKLELENADELAQVMYSLNFMAQVYGATPRQVMKRVTQRTRGLPFAERSFSINTDMDRLSLFLDRSIDDMKRVADKVKEEITTLKLSDDLASAYNRYYDTLIAKSINAADHRATDIARRREFFAGATKEQLHDPDFWERFYLETDDFWNKFDLDQLDFDAILNQVAREQSEIMGVVYPTRAPLKLGGRALAPQDIAHVLNCRVDDITKDLMSALALRQDKPRFVKYVMQHVQADDVGITPESVGEVYDQLVYSLQTNPKTLDWMTPRLKELEVIRRDLHGLYNSKLLPEAEIAEIGRYVDDIARKVDDMVYEAPARVPKPAKGVAPVIPKRVLRPEFAKYNDLRQSAMDEAHKWYYKEFTDYTSANVFDAMMKTIYPYWSISEDTEVMSRRGWKHYWELTKYDELLSFDKDTELTYWDKIQYINVYDYDGEAVHVKDGKGKDFICTPNHWWLVKKQHKDEWEFVQAEDLKHLARLPKAARHSFGEESMLTPDEAAILGWVVTDGTIKTRDYAMYIQQKKEHFVAEIRELLGRVGCMVSEKVYDGCHFFRINPEYRNFLAGILDEYGLVDVVGCLSEEAAESMWQAMYHAEGRIDGNGFVQNEGEVLDAFELLSFLTGRFVSNLKHSPGRRYIYTNKSRYSWIRNRDISKVYYKGKMWCPRVEHRTILIRRNHKVCWTGNTYESQRWLWIPRSFVRHPGTFTAFERWQNNSDYGYVHIPGTSIDINPFRGTVYGTLTTRLARRDFPEYYDSLGAAGDFLEFNDFLSRYGFYPGAHIGVPIAMFTGQEMQFGEVTPAIPKTGLDFLMGIFPDNESVKWITDHLFGDRFRDYLTILQVTRRGGDGSLIFSKMGEGEALTDEEQLMWNEARREVGFYSAGFEQFGLFRMRTDEQYKMYEEAGKVVQEMTGFTPDQQQWLRRHGYRIWDMVGGMSPTEQAVLQELDYYSWVGNVRPLLPGKQQTILNKLELAWDDVKNYSESLLEDKLVLQDDFRNGRIGSADYGDALSAIYAKQMEYIDNKVEENPLMDLGNRAEYYKKYGIPQPVLHPMRELLNLYFSIELEQTIDPDTGEKVNDWDKFWAMRDAIEQAIPDEKRQEWDDYLSRNSTALEQLRRDHNKYIKPYNGLWEEVLSTYSDEEQKLIREYLHLERTGTGLERQVVIKDITREDGKKLISSFRTDVSSTKQAFRYANPSLDAILFYWGKTSTFMTPEAEAFYQQLCSDTGKAI